MSGSEEQFGPPDKRLRETLERELGEVPPESPSEPPAEPETEGDADERESREEAEGSE
jgi:hypothetical protein